jgi:uncharacterized protein (TIGR03437 family)
MLVCSVEATAQPNVVVNFDPSAPTVGPFPTDFLTISDASQKTGRSIHLPMPDCAAQPSACTEVSLLNQLDGFALSPRIAVNFSGAIDASTLPVGIVIVWLDNLTTDEPGLGPAGQLTTINQVIFDPATNTAYAKPNGPFDQHRRYALIVTDAVLDTNGNPVAADPNFSQFFQSNGATIPDANALLQGLFPVQLTTPMFETPGRDLETVTLSQQPSINSVLSATGTASSVQPNIQTGSWVAIYGSNLASATADWTGLISNGKLPTSVGGVSVKIGGQPAFIYVVSPNQINLQAPDVASGDVEVVVTNQGTDSPPFKAHLGVASPAFFQLGASKYAIATRYPDNALVANPLLGTGFVGAKAGDILTLWATGFGPTSPAQPSGVLTNNAPTVAQTVAVTVGGIAAEVIGAVLSPGFAGLYQIAIKLPGGVPAGDVLIKASAAGFNTPDNVYLFVVQ